MLRSQLLLKVFIKLTVHWIKNSRCCPVLRLKAICMKEFVIEVVWLLCCISDLETSIPQFKFLTVHKDVLIKEGYNVSGRCHLGHKECGWGIKNISHHLNLLEFLAQP